MSEDSKRVRAKCGAVDPRGLICDRDPGHLAYHYDSRVDLGWKQQPSSENGQERELGALEALREQFSEMRSIIASEPRHVDEALGALDYCIRSVSDKIAEVQS